MGSKCGLSMSEHRHCCCDDWLLFLFLILAIETNRSPEDKGSTDSNAGCAGCLGGLFLLALLVAGVLFVLHTTHPAEQVPSPTPPGAVHAVYTQVEADYAPRAELVALKPAQVQPQVRRALPIEVRRAILVKLPRH